MMRLPRWTGYGVALGAMLLIGCSANMLGTSPDTVKPAGKVTLYDNPQGYGAVVMRVVDERRGYGTQAVADVEGYDELRIRLGGSKITTRYATLSAEPTHQYQSEILGMLPPGNDYNLTVSLASQSVLHGGPILVGQGGVDGITVQPGTTQTVTVYINSVGEIYLFSYDYMLASSSVEISPEVPGFGLPEVLSESSLNVYANFPADPEAFESWLVNRMRVQLNDAQGNVLVSSASAFVPVFEGTGYVELALPYIPTTEKLGWLTVYGIRAEDNPNAQGDIETVMTTKTRGILMLKGATLSVDLNSTPQGSGGNEVQGP